MSQRRSRLFKPRTRKPSFVLAVIRGAFRMAIILVLMLALSGAGIILGIAKAYVETAPMLDIEKSTARHKLRFFMTGTAT